MLNDVSGILQGIEFDNPAGIKFALANLKEHIYTFARIFHKNLESGHMYTKGDDRWMNSNPNIDPSFRPEYLSQQMNIPNEDSKGFKYRPYERFDPNPIGLNETIIKQKEKE